MSHVLSPDRRNWRRPVLVAIAVAAALVLVAATALAITVRRLEGNVERQDVFGALPEDGRPQDGPAGAQRSGAQPQDDDAPLDVLVLGSDSRTDDVGSQFQGEGADFVEGQRADTTLLVHLPADRSGAWLVSIPRDSWVALPACADPDRAGEGQFNTAFENGGVPCTVAAVEALTGVRIDHTAVVDFTGFTDMVDALGGVPVCLEQPFRPEKVDVALPRGRSVLEGREALAFVRARYGVGDGTDLDRIDRQKQFMAAMLDKALSRGMLVRPDRLLRFLSAATRSVTVDEDMDLRGLALSLRGIEPSQVVFSTVPLDPAPGPEFERGGRLFGRVAWDDAAAARLFTALERDLPPGQLPPDPTATATEPAPAPGTTTAAEQQPSACA